MKDHNYCHILVGMLENDTAYAKMFEHLLQQSPDMAVLKNWPAIDEALLELPHQAPDILVMDIQWPGGKGIEYLRKMKAVCPGVQFLVYTRCAEEEKVFEALRAGASGYLLKGERPEMLVNAIRDLHTGGAPMSSPISRKVVASFSRKPTGSGCLEVLTPREVEVMALLAEGKMYKEVSMRLGIEMETTKKHIRNIYGKLQVQNRTEAINKWQWQGSGYCAA